MTLKEWQARSDFKNAWKEFLRGEPGKALKDVLINLGLPTPTMPPVNVDFVDWNATLNARREGFFEAIKLLGVLAEDIPDKEDFPAPWEQNTTINKGQQT
ncbi:hypothetical protein EBR78_11215 [bacterium]|nr:hypothetical protein [bacterium]